MTDVLNTTTEPQLQTDAQLNPPGLLEQFDTMISDAHHLSAAANFLATQLEAKRDSLARLATDLNEHRKISADADNVVSQMIDFMVGKP